MIYSLAACNKLDITVVLHLFSSRFLTNVLGLVVKLYHGNLIFIFYLYLDQAWLICSGFQKALAEMIKQISSEI